MDLGIEDKATGVLCGTAGIQRGLVYLEPGEVNHTDSLYPYWRGRGYATRALLIAMERHLTASLAVDSVEFFPTTARAAAYVEVVDVGNGVYEARQARRRAPPPRPPDETTVRLERSGDRDEAHLIELLERERVTRRVTVVG